MSNVHPSIRPIALEGIQAALRNLRSGPSLRVHNTGPTDLGSNWGATLHLYADPRGAEGQRTGSLVLYIPGQRRRSWQVGPSGLVRKGDKPVSIGISDLGVERIAPKLLEYVQAMMELIRASGYLVESKVLDIRYLTEWPGMGWMVKLSESGAGWISVGLLGDHPEVAAAVEAAERDGREKYLATHAELH